MVQWYFVMWSTRNIIFLFKITQTGSKQKLQFKQKKTYLKTFEDIILKIYYVFSEPSLLFGQV